MDPECHPRLTDDLDSEQNEFLLTKVVPCVEVVYKNATGETNPLPSQPRQTSSILGQVVERETNPNAVAPMPIFKAPPKPVIKIKSKEHVAQVPEPELPEETVDISVLKSQVSAENEKLLASMSKEEILALQEEIESSLPESFLRKLRQ